MDGPEVLGELPATYAKALRLRHLGLTASDIAARLDVPLESIHALLQLAEAKFTALQPAPPTGETGHQPST